ncbi:hypothetical protein RBJ15_07925 [Pantoea sp. BS_4]|uniref:hypothetical protein n=1 Tax=Pantoea TaxID=53335 RepID=UPI001561CC3D|nr:hypothetical protein [Pantoea stewartii]NRH24671.1 hypothetical protein [Pantoea stewartii]
MDALQLASKVDQGNGKAAKRLGIKAIHYRATTAFSPLKAEPLKHLHASFIKDYGYMRPARFGEAARIGIFDTAGVEVGDVLVSSEGTYYVAAMPLLQPVLCVKAERMISLRRTGYNGHRTGIQDYSGITAANEKLIMSDWPASILLTRMGAHSPLKIPGETSSAWHTILMPAFRGIAVHSGDFITDDTGQRYVLTGTELTDKGWRLTAMKVTV